MSINYHVAFRASQLLIGSSLIGIGINAAVIQPSWGESTFNHSDLLAQQVVDGLPPPPSFPPADLSDFPPPPDPSTTSAPSSESSTDQLFMVSVNGSSPLLLEQVRQVQPDALIQEYDGQPIILVGAYENAALANQQIAALDAQGISATVTPVPSSIFEPVPLGNEGFADIPELPPADFNAASPPSETTPTSPQPVAVQPSPPREIEFAPVPTATQAPPANQTFNQPQAVAPSSTGSNTPLADNAYYIVIPGSSENLADVRDQVIILGGRYDVVSQRERPLGPHVLVGPFINRQAASRWNSFLRDFGMNARVYYRR